MNTTPEKTSTNLTIAMIISMMLWGVSWPSSHELAAYGSPIDLGIFRYLFVVLSLLPILIILKVPIKISRKGIPFVLISAALMAVYNYSFLKGLQTGSAGAGGILVTTMNPIMAYILGIIIDWKRPNRNEAIGITLGIIAGLTMLEIWTNVNILANPWNGLFLLSAFLWSVMSKFTSKAGRYGSSFSFSWWMYLLTLVFLLPFMDTSEVVRLVHIKEFTFWGNLLFGSIIVTTLATTMYFFATAKIGAEKASSFIFTVPFTAAISAWLILGEKIEIHTIVGGVIGIGAVYMINRKIKV